MVSKRKRDGAPPKGRRYKDAGGRWRLNGRFVSAPKQAPRDRYGRFASPSAPPAPPPKRDERGRFAPGPVRKATPVFNGPWRPRDLPLASTGPWLIADSRNFSSFIAAVYDAAKEAPKGARMELRVDAYDEGGGRLLRWRQPWDPATSSWIVDLNDALINALIDAGLTEPIPPQLEDAAEASTKIYWRTRGSTAVYDGPPLEAPDDGAGAFDRRTFDPITLTGEFWRI